jgi:hypothetical protein
MTWEGRGHLAGLGRHLLPAVPLLVQAVEVRMGWLRLPVGLLLEEGVEFQSYMRQYQMPWDIDYRCRYKMIWELRAHISIRCRHRMN